MPTVLGAANDLLATNPHRAESLPLLRQFSKLLHRVDDQFSAWRHGATSRGGGHLFTSRRAPRYPPGHIMAEEYATATLDDGQALLSYWAGKLLLRGAQGRVRAHFSGILGGEDDAAAVPWLGQALESEREMAHSIVRMMPQFTNADMGFVGLRYVVIPLKAAVEYYQSHHVLEGLECTDLYLGKLLERGIGFVRIWHTR